LVAGRNRVPSPAAAMMALVILMVVVSSPRGPHYPR
jgi:hypothetical protein